MKRFISVILTAALCVAILCGCSKNDTKTDESLATSDFATADLGNDSDAFGESLSDLNAYAGYFEEDVVDVDVACVSGTPDCYKLDGNTLTFTSVSEDSVYSVSGRLKGSIVIDAGDDCKFDLEMRGLSLVSDSTNPVTVLSGDEVSLTAKSEYENYIYDTREAVDETDETQYSGAVYSLTDLEVCGKGKLTLVSENNNGIHSKDDLQVKNLNLLVACVDNALKGNDSVTLTDGNTTLIASQGDGIKTTNSDISQKGNQRGTVTVAGGSHTIYAACDGIDAAYNVVVDGDLTELNIYTDKYSNYSSEVTAVNNDEYYIRFESDSYKYSVKYYNSDDDFCWVNAEYHSEVSGEHSSYYYYSFPKMGDYSQLQFFIYSSDMDLGQEKDYLAASDYLAPSTGYDTIALTSQGGSLGYSWTNYTTTVQENDMMMGRGGMGGKGGMDGRGGMGGMSQGNTDKGDYSTKGVKAGNEVVINAGNISIKSYDDAIHANCDTTLENGEAPTGNVTVSGGTITVYSNDDGLHADGTLSVSGGTVSVTNSYEGLEGNAIAISGGNISVVSLDDGLNGTSTLDTGIAISGGRIYVYASGDGIDSNSRTSYSGIVFSGGNTVVISNSNGNSAIDTEQGYKYTSGSVLAIMPSGGMSNESANCQNFSSIASGTSASLNSGEYLTVSVNGTDVVTVQMPVSLSANVIYLGSNSASVSTASSSSLSLDGNGVYWSK